MKRFGLIGKTLSHSFSQHFFSAKFEKEGLDSCYDNIELSDISLVDEVLKKGNFSGLNVTIPYKQSIIPYLDELSPEAAKIGAVNTIVFDNWRTIGYNTDAHGFHQSIKPFLTNKHERALLLGTGGASLAVAYVLKNIGIDVHFVSRTPENGQFSYSEINQHMVNAFKLIVNCTPLGTFPNVEDCVDFPFQFLTEDHLCVDLIYNPSETKFLRLSKENGATILNGESMLKEQALKAWDLWINTK